MTFAPESRFLFAVCQQGAEPALKSEVDRLGMGLVPAYSRPGFVTFKSPSPLSPYVELELTFARAYGLSLGRVENVDEAASSISQNCPGRSALHVFPRDPRRPGDEADSLPGWDQAESFDKELRRRLSMGEDVALIDASLVCDVLILEPSELIIGCHAHGPSHSPWPGGRFRIAAPNAAPSRAYLKLQEALEWSGIEVRRGRWALEVGASPGGAVYALLERGARVVAVDPRKMDERLLERPELIHLRRRVEQVHREDLPDDIELLTMDMGLSPRFAMHHLERLVALTRRSLRAFVVTLKLKEWHFADELPEFVARARAQGFANVRVRQLSWNRQEVCLIGRREP
ncbi:MAG: hypothetical protein HY791_27610 [Deltaproteobacteria bacterium]|nr:hypothetical protein [Deltaproteobacteria bacterium]